jgi:hypothetical protein
MISNIQNRLSTLLPPSVISRKGALALSSSSAGVDGLRWWIDCQSNPKVRYYPFAIESFSSNVLDAAPI